MVKIRLSHSPNRGSTSTTEARMRSKKTTTKVSLEALVKIKKLSRWLLSVRQSLAQGCTLSIVDRLKRIDVWTKREMATQQRVSIRRSRGSKA